MTAKMVHLGLLLQRLDVCEEWRAFAARLPPMPLDDLGVLLRALSHHKVNPHMPSHTAGWEMRWFAREMARNVDYLREDRDYAESNRVYSWAVDDIAGIKYGPITTREWREIARLGRILAKHWGMV